MWKATSTVLTSAAHSVRRRVLNVANGPNIASTYCAPPTRRAVSTLAHGVRQGSRQANSVRQGSRQAWNGGRTAYVMAGVALAGSVGAGVAHTGEFESCDVIGDGLKGEFWKARHKNINVLELESEVVQCMMTKLRDKNLSDQGFVLLAERIAFFVIEHALAELPTKEMTVETVYGHKYTGMCQDSSVKLCGVGVAENGGQMLSVLTKLRPDMPVAHMQINRGTRHFSIIPQINDIYERYCLVLCPLMKTGQTALDSISRLLKAGVQEDHIIFVSITAGPGALDELAKQHPKMTVVTASVESGLDKKYQLMPGVGVFGLRYRRDGDDDLGPRH